MRFVLEQQQPVFLVSVDLHFDFHRTGVDLFRFVEFFEKSPFFEKFCGNRADIHEVFRFGTAQFLPRRQIVVISVLQQFVLELYVVDRRKKRRMTAMIRPIGIDHTDLGERRIALFGFEIILTELDIVFVHRQRVFFDKGRKSLFVQLQKSVKRFHFRGNRMVDFEGYGNGKTCLAALHGIDNVMFDRGKFRFGYVAVYRIHLCGTNDGTAAHGNKLNALRRRIGTLVELSGQILYRKYARTFKPCRAFRRRIHLRLGKHRPDAPLKQFFLYFFRIVTV